MKITVKDMTLCALFAALISIGAQFSIPISGTVPFSFQPLFAMMAGAILGSKRGGLSMLLYLFMGLIGLPVFSNGTGGIGMVASPTFGYLIGFVVCAYITGFIVEKSRAAKFLPGMIVAPFVGLALDYIIGVPYLYYVFNFVIGNAIDLSTALAYGFTPFILLDLIKAGIVVSLLLTIVPLLERQGLLD